jgi:cell wall-associated NlpC family hydrolase
VRKPTRRTLPTVIGVTVVTTLAANGAVLLARADMGGQGRNNASGNRTAQLVAAADATNLPPDAVAPLQREITPDLMVAGPNTITSDVLAKIKAIRSVKSVETMDAVQANVNGKTIGLIGVNPSTFRAYTPKPTAESDPLWRNIAAGDIAVSFPFGHDGNVPLASYVPIVGKSRQIQARVGAYATMGISDIDGVVSHATAQTLGMPTGNALLISAPKANADKLSKQLLKTVLPKGEKVLSLHPKLNYIVGSNGQIQQLPDATGTFLTDDQILTAIRAAESKIGVPYVWGGTGNPGYDCSGLVQYAMGVAGVRMPRVAADQARTGPIVPYSQARVGDLLVWANDPTNPGYIDHIAIYIGDGKMVAAPHTGVDVMIENVYTSTLVGAVRVDPQLAARVAAGG